MKTNRKNSIVRSVALAASMAIAASVAFAADPTDHNAHHPEGATSAAKAPAAKAPVVQAKTAASKMAPAMAMMDTKIQTMHDMHEK